MNNYPIPVLSENPQRSSFQPEFFIKFREFSKSYESKNSEVFLNLIIDTNIFETNLILPEKVFFMIKISTFTKSYTYTSLTNDFHITINENELLNQDLIEIKAFIISNESFLIFKNKSLIDQYPENISFEIHKNFVLAETNKYKLSYNRDGRSYFVIRKKETNEKNFSVSIEENNHIYINVENHFYKIFTSISKIDKYFEFVSSSLILLALNFVLTTLASCSEDEHLNYSQKQWYKLLSYSVENSELRQPLSDLVETLKSDNGVDPNTILESSQQILNYNYTESLIKVVEKNRTLESEND
jgi:hypothetical protein